MTGSIGLETESSGKPYRLPHVRQFAVRDELILVAPEDEAEVLDVGANNLALAINRTGRAIWDLCDGHHSPEDIVRKLEPKFDVDSTILLEHVGQALADLSRLRLIGGFVEHSRVRMPTTFAIGIEDRPYFWWQTAIFLESFRGKLPAGWQAFVTVCNDGAPLSDQLRSILETYGTKYALSTNHASTNRIDVGHEGGMTYAAVNKLEALAVAAKDIDPTGMICLIDSDMFLYGDLPLDIMPTRCAMPRNWHIERDVFFATIDRNEGKGVDLHKLLDAVGCDRQFAPGGVNVFVTAEVAGNKKFIADCYRFAHALYLLGRIAGAELAWIAEMPCFALAMTANGIGYDLLEQKEFLVSDCSEPSIPDGTFYHYYSDPKDFGQAAFKDSRWHKQAYVDRNFLDTEFDAFARNATTEHEKYFFQLAERARTRLNV